MIKHFLDQSFRVVEMCESSRFYSDAHEHVLCHGDVG